MRNLVPYMKHEIIPEPVPFINEYLDIPTMLSIIVKHWDREWMINARDISCKSSRANSVGRDVFVPKEEVYRLNLVCKLYSWLPKSFEIFTEAKVHSEKKKGLSVDVLLISKKERILFELVAHTGRNDVEEHINRAKVYRKALKTTSTYVIHFTTSPKINEYPFSMKNDEVSVIHVQHSPSFDAIKLYQHKGEEPVSL